MNGIFDDDTLLGGTGDDSLRDGSPEDPNRPLFGGWGTDTLDVPAASAHLAEPVVSRSWRLRVTVSMLLGQLAAGGTLDDIVADYPYLEREDVIAALEYAAAVVNEREVPIARLA